VPRLRAKRGANPNLACAPGNTIGRNDGQARSCDEHRQRAEYHEYGRSQTPRLQHGLEDLIERVCLHIREVDRGRSGFTS
jgi:hypothetical protein